MAKLVFKVASDYQEVIRLRQECEKLEAQLKKMDVNKSPAAAKALETQLASTRQQMMGLVTEAAKAGAVMENDFKTKIFNASQAVNDFTQKIIDQKNVVKDTEFKVKQLGDAYKTALKRNSFGASSKFTEYSAAKKALEEDRIALFNLTQQQAEARLSVKRLKDEYAAFKEEAGETVQANEKMSLSLTKVLGIIGGVTALKGFASELIRVRGEFQSMETAIETLVGKNMANKLIPQIKELAKISPLTMSDMVGAEKMMLGFNIQAEDTIRYLQALSDISMGDSVKFNSLTLAFSQMSAAGKLMGQDLNQMINAGFNPLQIISEKTGKSIATLKEEMSKGAVSAEMVQQAFIDATSAGGKFYGMSENASKTINGQISMMQDALDAAFNEIGQASEGVIMKGIQATTSLIQNYETVGKVLIGLIATYGTYKAALITNIALTRSWAVAARADATAKAIQIVMTKAQTVAQAALNAVMKANPYVLVATAIVGVVSAMWALHDSSTEAEKAQKKLNERQLEAQKEAEEQKRRIDALVESSRDIALSDLQRGQSLAELRKEYPKIFAQYDIESIKLADILKLKQQIAEEDTKRAGEKKEQEFNNIESEIKYYENLLKSMSGQQGVDGYVEKLKELRAERDILLQDKGKGISEQFILSLKNIDISEFDRYISELEKRIKGKGENGKIKMRLPIDVKGSLSDEALFEVKDIKTLIDIAKSTKQSRIDAKKNQTTYQQDLAAAKADWEKAKKGYEALIKDQKATSEQVKKAREDMEAKEKAYKELGGATETKTNNTNKQKQEKLYDQLLQLRLKNQQDEINLMEEGSEKKRRQIEFDYQKEYVEIQKLEKEWSEKNGGKLTQEQSIEISRRYTNAEKKYDTGIASLEGGFSPEELEKSMNEYLSVYGNYIEKRNAIIALGEEKKKGKNEWEQKSIDEETKRTISDLDIEAAKTTSVISQLFGDMRDKTLKDLKEINEKGSAALEFLKSGEWNEKKGLEFGLTKEQFETISQSPEKLKDISDALKDNMKAADDLRPAYDKVADGLKKVFNSGNDTKKLKEGLSDIREGMNDIMQVGSFLSDTLSSLGESFGNDTLSNIAEGINVAMDAANSAMQGAQAGAMFGPIGAAAGAAIGAVSSLATSIAKIHDKKNEKNIEKLQDQIDVLSKSYEILGKEIDNAYSADASKLINQQNELLEQQKVLIQQQMAEESDKKNSDDERLKEYQEQLDAIDEQLEENKQKAIDVIFGEDLQSAIENFSSAYADAWANGENRAESAKETVKNMMKQMVTESIKAAMQSSEAMEKIRLKLQEFYADEVLSSWEQDYIYNMAEELQQKLDKKFGWADSLMSESDSKQTATTGYSTTASQESIDEFNGRLSSLVMIEENSRVAITELKGPLINIYNNSSSIKNIADETRTILANSYLELQQIRENTGEIVKPIKQMQADIAEVKRNTSRL